MSRSSFGIFRLPLSKRCDHHLVFPNFADRGNTSATGATRGKQTATGATEGKVTVTEQFVADLDPCTYLPLLVRGTLSTPGHFGSKW